MHLEDAVEHERRHFELLHESVSSEDDRVVDDNGAEDVLRRGKKRLAGHKLELGHHKATVREQLKELLHVREEVDPKRLVDAGNRERGHAVSFLAVG